MQHPIMLKGLERGPAPRLASELAHTLGATVHSIPTYAPLAVPFLPQVSVEAQLAQTHANEHMPSPGPSGTYTYICVSQLVGRGVTKEGQAFSLDTETRCPTVLGKAQL